MASSAPSPATCLFGADAPIDCFTWPRRPSLGVCDPPAPTPPSPAFGTTSAISAFAPSVPPAYGFDPFAPAWSFAFGEPSRSPFGSDRVHSPIAFGPAPAKPSAFGSVSSSAFGFGNHPATSSGFGSTASRPFGNFHVVQPFGGGWTGEALSSSQVPSLFSDSHLIGPANLNPSPAPPGWSGWPLDDEWHNFMSVSALGLKDSHEELRLRYYQEKGKEITKKSNSSAITKIVTISLEDRPKPHNIVMTAPLFPDTDQKLPMLDNVPKYSFMMGDHKVTIQIEGPESDGAAAKIETLLPKLRNAEYYTVPSIKELAAREKSEWGYLSRVNDFLVGRLGYGTVMFPGETDVRGLELDSIVQFNSKEVALYPDGKMPSFGVGLNKLGVVTLYNVKYYDEKGVQFKAGPIVEKIKRLLMKTASENGAEFLSYDAASGVWKFAMKKKVKPVPLHFVKSWHS